MDCETTGLDAHEDQILSITMSSVDATHAHGQGEVRCKVCGRSVQDKNAVAGMGPQHKSLILQLHSGGLSDKATIFFLDSFV
jgi:hypothetical protein